MIDLPVNVGAVIVLQIQNMLIGESKSLLFPSLIICLCQEVDVAKRDGDRMWDPKKLIHPLKKKGSRMC